ncbi:hypothetical protein A0H76_2842 [Hepatospora eriocheir]|uniref:ISXO2-like transposase domain-containing protein n=1 Tax=Hepatospora eriocheir TaxID=1081669 RepID=A0A1X0Q5N2_9MICR|nr:hypothetical protein A0H76_2842 [Hepatospora eriocheir]
MIVQIDEVFFIHKQKYHQGRQPKRKVLVFSLADVLFTPAKISLHVVSNRTASTLLPIKVVVSLPRSVIHSNEWCVYIFIGNSNLRFSHFTICHTETFVNRQIFVHTQNIESSGNKCKYVLKIHKGIVASKDNFILKY